MSLVSNDKPPAFGLGHGRERNEISIRSRKSVEDGDDKRGMSTLMDEFERGGQTWSAQVARRLAAIDEQLVEQPAGTPTLPDDALRLQPDHPLLDQLISAEPSYAHVAGRLVAGHAVATNGSTSTDHSHHSTTAVKTSSGGHVESPCERVRPDGAPT